MGMFNQDETITDEFFTSNEEQVENKTAESQDELLDENNQEKIVEDNVDNEDESSTKEQDESALIAGKFKSQDDLVNAYKNLEKEFTKTRQQNKQPNPEQITQTQQTQQNTTDPNELFWTNFQQDPLGVLNYLVSQSVQQGTQPIHQQRADEILGKDIDKLAKDYKQIQSEEGLSSLFNKAQEIAMDLGNEQLARTPRVLKMAAIEAFGDAKADLYKKAKEDGKKEAEETRRTKQELSTITSSKKPNEKTKTAEEELADSILGASHRKGVFG